MLLEKAKEIAEKVKDKLKSFCKRIEIAGSIRREKSNVKDIEIVAIVNNKDRVNLELKLKELGQRIKGGGKFIQIRLKEGINLDFFMTDEEHWACTFQLRTGSAEFNVRFFVWLKSRGFKIIGGRLYKGDKVLETKEEEDIFRLVGLKWIPPKFRTKDISFREYYLEGVKYRALHLI